MKSFEYIKKMQEKLNNKNLDSYSVIWALNELNPKYTYDNIEIDEETKMKLDCIMNTYLDTYLAVQYQFGYSYFYSRRFKVNKNTIIPRFDTEEVVERAIYEAKLLNTPLKICDIGCGSGVIGITMLLEVKDSNMTFIDIDKLALEVTKENIKTYNLENRSNVINNDILNNINDKFDMIVSNPPYIDNIDDCGIDVVTHEPHHALFAPNEGMYFYEQILKSSYKNLNKNGVIVFEIGYNQGDKIIKLAKTIYPSCYVKVYIDLNGNNRLAVIKEIGI